MMLQIASVFIQHQRQVVLTFVVYMFGLFGTCASKYTCLVVYDWLNFDSAWGDIANIYHIQILHEHICYPPFLFLFMLHELCLHTRELYLVMCIFAIQV